MRNKKSESNREKINVEDLPPLTNQGDILSEVK